MEISKLVLPDSPSRRQNLVQNMRPREDNQQLNFINVSSTDVDADSSILSAPSRRRKQNTTPIKRKKPYKTDEQRRQELEADPYARRVEPRHVLCGHCNTWVKLRNSTKYCPTPWHIHIKKCVTKSPEELRVWSLKAKRPIVPPSDDGDAPGEREAAFPPGPPIGSDSTGLTDSDGDRSDEDEGMDDDVGDGGYGSRAGPSKISPVASTSSSMPRDTRPFQRAPTPPWHSASKSP